MKYLRLQTNDEFFKDDLKVFFLGGIENINIIVGANNTRKSRFLRNLINQEFKVIIDAPEFFNNSYINSKTIFDEVTNDNKQSLIEKLIQFQFDPTGAPNTRYTNIKEFCGSNSQVDLNDFKINIENINNTLFSSGSPDAFREAKSLIRRTCDTAETINLVYERLIKDGLPDSRNGSLFPSGVPNLRCGVTATHQGIPNLEVRLSTITKIVST